ncbi:MAG: hypothetical protein HY308_05520 [Gammaproteobacteria bacterium]|nr:hypothetical protein [Gammaproteobacteria bacterium]
MYIGVTLSTLIVAGTAAADWSGSVALEYRGFTQTPLDDEQHRHYFSVAAQPEYVYALPDSKDQLRFVPFVRVDQYDSERSHADIRELSWTQVGDSHEWRIGIGKVFWGVTESQHLVDIVNQTDLVENSDGEDKLGQPMVNLALIRDWGTVDLFVLPYFRERTFAGAEGRLRWQPRVDTEQAVYESSRGRDHVDYAARWAKSWSGIDLGLSYFSGTSRDPRLTLGSDAGGNLVLVPHYELIHQAGLDLAAVQGAWLWKLEAIYRSGIDPAYFASTAGFEYTLSGAFDSGVDLGLLAEYLYDDRGDDSPSPFQDDAFAGVRLAFNDAASSELLFGIVQDLTSQARMFNLEASRRLGDQWKLSVEARAVAAAPADDPVFPIRRDDYVQLELARYF